MHHLKGEITARIWLLILAVILILNFGLIAGIQIMVAYPYENLMDIRALYTDYNEVDFAGDGTPAAILLAAPAKENRLVITEKHFLANRCRIVLDEEVGRNFSTKANADLGTISIRLKGSTIESFHPKHTSLPIRISSLQFRVPVNFLLWNFLVLAIECMAAYLIYKLRSK